MSRSNPTQRPSEDKYYIGTDKPSIIKKQEKPDWPGRLYAPWELKDEADNLPESPEQAGWDDIREDTP